MNLKALSILVFFVGLSAQANSTLGLPNGIYEGQGVLISQQALVPNLSFHSVRQLVDGNIIVQTKASKFGVVLADATAHLKVVAKSATVFEMWNQDTGQLAGGGTCDRSSCTFEVGVMPDVNGLPQLTLKETWVGDEEGFTVVQGSQVFKGKKAIYEGTFRLINY